MIRILACVCLVVCLAGSALVRSQETKPNLTGRWDLNMKLSKLDWPPKHEGGGSKPGVRKECCETRSAYEIIDDKEPNITIARTVVELDEDGKERTRKIVTKMTTDDHETVNTDGDTERVTAHWNTDRLIINTVYENGRFPRNIELRSLSKNGKTMTVQLYVGRVEGQPVVTEVFERSDK